MAYDIVGDIHGQADKLEALLKRMGYSQIGGIWGHPERTAIFVGDFIDRGMHQLRTVEIVRSMVQSGTALAVMGNHEFNAIAWATPHPSEEGEYLRPHCEENFKQHGRFLAEIDGQPERHQDILKWFMTLPLWLDLPKIRVIHACWHQDLIAWLKPQLTDRNQLTPDLVQRASQKPKKNPVKKGPSAFSAVEVLLKGLEIALPTDNFVHDKDGTRRHEVRTQWWDSRAIGYREAAILHGLKGSDLPDLPIPEHARLTPPADKPIFFGHYWFTGMPRICTPTSACVDYSAGNGGDLVAYRWDGESHLNSDHFIGAA